MSIFLHTSSKPFLSFLLQEAIGKVMEKCPDESMLVVLAAAHKLANLPVPKHAELGALAERLQQQTQEKPANEKAAAAAVGAGMGKELVQWLGKMSTDKLCLLACNYNYEQARILYCDLDVEVAETVLTLKMDQYWQEFRAQFEASLYGFGGKLDGHDDTPATVVDMNDERQINQMINDFKTMGL